MFQTWRLGRLFNIETSIHWSFWLLIVWVLLNTTATGGLASGISACLFLIAVFGCVYLHELGHAFAAKHYGIRTIDITILPIGGLARLERLPQVARQEFWIALAGPAVNIVIALALGIGLVLRGDLAHLRGADVFRQNFLEQLVFINLILAVFNMLPALPMDGGRVLRSLLQFRMTRLQATEIAARVSRYLAFFLFVIGLFKGWTLCLIALFVLFSGFQELMAVRMQAWKEAGGVAGFGHENGPFATSKGAWFESHFSFGRSSSIDEFDQSSNSERSRRDNVLDAEDIKRIE